MVFDGLAGISQRPVLLDLVHEIQRKGEPAYADFLAAIRRARSGYVAVYFSDYVSYGIGGGDACSEFFLGRYILLHEPERPATDTQPFVPEHLALQRPGGWERLAIART